MGQILRLILHDHITGDEWRTPEHNDNKKKDDYHDEVKQELKKLLSNKIRAVFGTNGDFEIEDGKIIYVSQRYSEKTGGQVKKTFRLDIPAEDYFDQVSYMLLFTAYDFAMKYKVRLIIEIEPTEEYTIVVSVE